MGNGCDISKYPKDPKFYYTEPNHVPERRNFSGADLFWLEPVIAANRLVSNIDVRRGIVYFDEMRIFPGDRILLMWSRKIYKAYGKDNPKLPNYIYYWDLEDEVDDDCAVVIRDGRKFGGEIFVLKNGKWARQFQDEDV